MDRYANDATVAAAAQLVSKSCGMDIRGIEGRWMLTGSDGLDRHQFRQEMNALDLHFLYAGLPDEARAVERVLATGSSYIDPNRVTIISQEKGNTITQLQALGGHISDLPHSKRIMLVGFAAHLTRALWLAETLKIFEGRRVDLALLPTLASGLETGNRGDYPFSMVAQETKATLYYALKGLARRPTFNITALGNPWLFQNQDSSS